MWQITDEYGYQLATLPYNSDKDIVRVFEEGVKYYDAAYCKLVPTGLDEY